MLRQQENVAGTVPQRRQMDGEGAQPEKEIPSKPSGSAIGLQVAMGRRDDTDIYMEGRRSADAFKCTLLEDAEQHGLGLGGKFGHLVQEESAAVSQFKTPRSSALSTGECAALVAKELYHGHVPGENGAIDRKKGPGRSRRPLVNGTGRLFLPASSLSEKENRCGGGRHQTQALNSVEPDPGATNKRCTGRPIRRQICSGSRQRLQIMGQPLGSPALSNDHGRQSSKCPYSPKKTLRREDPALEHVESHGAYQSTLDPQGHRQTRMITRQGDNLNVGIGLVILKMSVIKNRRSASGQCDTQGGTDSKMHPQMFNPRGGQRTGRRQDPECILVLQFQDRCQVSRDQLANGFQDRVQPTHDWNTISRFETKYR
jgi:hypothetical protein